ncbi:MAG: replicative DNA helicase [Anaerolineae bacterium]
MSTTERLPPQNREAEEAVLGSLLIDPDAIFDVVGFLRPEMFYATVNRWIYEAILRIHSRNNPIDVLTLLEELRRNDQLEEVGGEPYLVGLVGVVPNSINVESYGRIVEAAGVRRDLLSAAGTIASMAYDEEEDISVVLDRSEQTLFSISEQRTTNDLVHVRRISEKYLEQIEELYAREQDIVGVPTGFTDLDKLTGGLNKSDLVILAARPGMGKTSLQNGIGLTAAKMFGKKVAIFNLEMSAEQLVQRMISTETQIDVQRLRRGQLQDHEWPIFHEAIQRLGETDIFIDDSPSISPMQLRTKCRRLYAEHGIDLIMIDYLQLMQGDKSAGGNRVQEIGEISRGLKQLARELDVPVLAAAQLSRGVESRQDKRPMLSDLRDSGSIEQDADIVMFIYRDDYYNPETSERPNIAEISIAKHRNGPTATIDLYWNGQLASFANLKRQEVQL